MDALEEFLEPVDGEEPDRGWSGRTQGGTISAFMRRLYAASHRVGHLIRAGESRRIDRADAQVTVVGIQSLHDLGQRFVVGALLQETFEEKEQTGQRLPLSVIVLDELNKYAPREGHSPLKEMLIDIAQRGRSLGVLLVGAQQTASRVAPEVLENASLRVAGRLDAAEAERSEYGWMLPSTRARARLAQTRDDGGLPASDTGSVGADLSVPGLGHPPRRSRRRRRPLRGDLDVPLELAPASC